MPTQPTRDEQIDDILRYRTENYEDIFHQIDAQPPDGVSSASEVLLPPDRVRELLRARVAKTGKIRFKKAHPPMELTDEDGSRVPNEAYLLSLLMQHQGYGAYLPIHSLLIANQVFGRDRYKLFERTAEVLYRTRN